MSPDLMLRYSCVSLSLKTRSSNTALSRISSGTSRLMGIHMMFMLMYGSSTNGCELAFLVTQFWGSFAVRQWCINSDMMTRRIAFAHAVGTPSMINFNLAFENGGRGRPRDSKILGFTTKRAALRDTTFGESELRGFGGIVNFPGDHILVAA